MFFDARKYDFSRVGRFKFNIKLDLDSPVTQKTMSAEDFFVVINYLLRLRKDVGRVDDIDNLGNRRVRAVGEPLENQFRIGLVAWSAPSRKRCRFTRTSTRRCRTT